MERRRISRGRFIGLAAGTMVAVSCGAPEERTPSRSGQGSGRSGFGSGNPTSYKEAPMLAEMVSSGKLPPVAERLPKEPFVVRPGLLAPGEFVEMKPGTYGGAVQLAQEAPTGDPVIFLGNIEPLLWAPDAFGFDKGIEGNVVEGYEANADDTRFTFHMRPGLRWSDGEPVTMEDVRFAFEDVLYNKDITPAFPPYLRAGRRSDAAPAKLEVIDDWTFGLKFDRPYGSFPAQIAIAQWGSYSDVIKPKHYLKQFHKKYADPEELEKKLDDASLPEDQWFNLFNDKQLPGWLYNMTTEQGLGHPTLTAWVIREVDSGSGVYTYERNPYYFKIDPNGSQLPYMDEIRSQIVQDQKALTARALMGEFDYLGERASLRQMPLIAEKARNGEIQMNVARMHRTPISFMLNLTYDDDNWRKVVRDLRFRQALSLAINREEIIENFYLGEFARLPEKTNPGEYNVEKANQLLDEVLPEKDSGGFRLGPDGEKFTIPFEIQDLSEDHIPMGELIAEYWKKVGVNTTVKQIDPTLYTERAEANDIQATAIWYALYMWPSAGWDDYLPYNGAWGQLWNDWYTTQGKDGEEPPDEIKKLFDMHGRFVSARIASPEHEEALAGILKSYRDNLWNFTPAEDSYYPTFWTTRVKNVPRGVKEDVFGIVVNISMEQWFIEE